MQLAALEDLKSWLGYDPTDATDDQPLTRLLAAASGSAEAYCQRSFSQASYSELLDGNGQNEINLANWPICSVQSLQIDGRFIPAFGPGVPNGWTAKDWKVSLVGYRFSRGEKNVAITYTAGYYVIPDVLQQAVIELAAYRWRNRNRIGLSSQAVDGQTTSFSQRDIPAPVRTDLDQFSRKGR